MRPIFSVTTGLAVGFGLIAIGASIFGYGTGRPINCGGTRQGIVCGNIYEVAGLVMVLIGIVTLAGTIIYGGRVWEGSDSEDSVSEVPGD